MTAAVVSFAIAAIAAVALLGIGAYALGVRHTNDLWVRKASERGGLRKECDGKLYYVANCADPESCSVLRDWIEADQERAEQAEYVRRIQGWK